MSKSIKFYYDLLSPISRGLWLGLKLGNSPIEYCPIALRKFEQLTEEYKKINRFQKVPAIVDGDFHLSETIAIIRYLSDKGKFDEKLYPKSVEARARVDEFLEWQHLTIRLACSVYFRDAWLFPTNGMAPKPKPEKIQALIQEVETNLGLMELLWLENDFLVGRNLTIADIIGSSEINQLRLCQYRVDDVKFPKVAKWLERVRDTANPFHDEALTFINRKSQQAAAAKL